MRALRIILPRLSIAMLVVCALSCEQTVQNPGDELYVERFVVFGRLHAGAPIDSIRFSRTLPLTAAYTDAAAALTTVSARITVDGNTTTLAHIGAGYYAAPGMTAVSGKTYALHAQWGDHVVTAQTRVPFPVQVDSIYRSFYTRGSAGDPYMEYGVDIFAKIFPRPDEAYQILEDSIYDPTGNRPWRDFYGSNSVQRVADTAEDGLMHLFVGGLSSELHDWYNVALSGTVTIAAFDTPYYDYYTTRPYSNGGGGSPFDIGGSQQLVKWNIRGDGIGMFVGEAVRVVGFQF